ncbi:unnamed protein product [Neospora caninum Liverpool]|uniref:non-specific serine/threonine protein kinase n=1 Tax=Neospora caninum (strain Liverpool) TaxID=572307 RepID=F0VL77_NEOCL|nr:uncharacterized protein NCLIV_052550 [Neospora caninum Liverpool]CBZ54829.1 unnamed protein product [Neospora caninum Liverpool]CEL69548.1 TPA: cAMP-dependent protein kinase [Neospora caninum Liverpool]|eukprot:XP_003884857.1 uncharacterized protein NCLIV_052550 [Neospora caninum Liverpool]
MDNEDDRKWLAFCMKVEEQELNVIPWCLSPKVFSPTTPVFPRNCRPERALTHDKLSVCSPKTNLEAQSEKGVTNDALNRQTADVVKPSRNRCRGLAAGTPSKTYREKQQSSLLARASVEPHLAKHHEDKVGASPVGINEVRSFTEHITERDGPESDTLEATVGAAFTTDSTNGCRGKRIALCGVQTAQNSFSSVFPEKTGSGSPLKHISGNSPESQTSRTGNPPKTVYRLPFRQGGDDGCTACPKTSTALGKSRPSNEQPEMNKGLACEQAMIWGVQNKECLFDFTKPRGRREGADIGDSRRASRGSIREGVGAAQIARKLRLFADFVTERKKKDEERVERQKDVRAILGLAAKLGERRKSTGQHGDRDGQQGFSVQETMVNGPGDSKGKDTRAESFTRESSTASAPPKGGSLAPATSENFQCPFNLAVQKEPRTLTGGPGDQVVSPSRGDKEDSDLLSRGLTAAKSSATQEKTSLLQKYLAALEEAQTAWLRAQRERVDTRRFRVLSVLGVGAYGVVRLVQDRQTGEKFALKQMEKRAVKMKNERTRLYAERHVLAEVISRHIVKLVCTFQDKHYLYQVLEYLPGGDLMTHLIACGQFSEETTKFYIAQLILAVHTVHRLGYLHRDIKPCNIVLDNKGNLKLLDFGLCALYHSPCDFAGVGGSRSDASDPSSNGVLEQRLPKGDIDCEETSRRQPAVSGVYAQREQGVEKPSFMQIPPGEFEGVPAPFLRERIAGGSALGSADICEGPNLERTAERNRLPLGTLAGNEHDSALPVSSPASSPSFVQLLPSPNSCCGSQEATPRDSSASASSSADFVSRTPSGPSSVCRTSPCARPSSEMQRVTHACQQASEEESVAKEAPHDSGPGGRLITACEDSGGAESAVSLTLPSPPRALPEREATPTTSSIREKNRIRPSISMTPSAQSTTRCGGTGLSLLPAAADSLLSCVPSSSSATSSRFLRVSTSHPAPSSLSPTRRALPLSAASAASMGQKLLQRSPGSLSSGRLTVPSPASLQRRLPVVNCSNPGGRNLPNYAASAPRLSEPSCDGAEASHALWQHAEGLPLSGGTADLSAGVQGGRALASVFDSPLSSASPQFPLASACASSPHECSAFAPAPHPLVPPYSSMQSPASPPGHSLTVFTDSFPSSFPPVSPSLPSPARETAHVPSSEETRKAEKKTLRAPTNEWQRGSAASEQTLPSSTPSTASPASSPTHISRFEALSQVGTPHYMAPEVLSGLAYSFSADWWSVGVILFECIYGGVPFNTPSYNPQLLSYIIINFRRFLVLPKCAGPKKAHVSAACRAVIQGLLCEPEKRWGFEELRKSAWLRKVDWDALRRGVWKQREKRPKKDRGGPSSGEPREGSERSGTAKVSRAAHAATADAEFNETPVRREGPGTPAAGDKGEPSLGEEGKERGVSSPQKEPADTPNSGQRRTEETVCKVHGDDRAPDARGQLAPPGSACTETFKRESTVRVDEVGCVAAEQEDEEEVTEGPLKLPSSAVPLDVSAGFCVNDWDRQSRRLPSWCRYTPAMTVLQCAPETDRRDPDGNTQRTAANPNDKRFAEQGRCFRNKETGQELQIADKESDLGQSFEGTLPQAQGRRRDPGNAESVVERFEKNIKAALGIQDERSNAIAKAALNQGGHRFEDVRVAGLGGSHAPSAGDWLALQPFRPKDEVLKDLRFLNFTFKREEKEYEAGVYALEEKIRQIVMSDYEATHAGDELETENREQRRRTETRSGR